MRHHTCYNYRMTSILLAPVVGLLAGFLINYLADVLPEHRRLVRPTCPDCGEGYTWMDYLHWNRRCMHCSRGRGMRLWVVELTSILASAWLILYPAPRMDLVSSFILLYYFLLVVVIDVEHHLILHSTSIFGAVMGIWIGIQLHGLLSTLVGGLAGFGAMLGLYALGMLVMRLLHRVQGDNQEGQEAEGLGFGDVNLAGVIGLLLGWPGIVLGLIITILLAGVASLAYLGYKGIRREIKAEMAIPYGPFLVGSVVILLYLRELFW